MPLTKEMQVPRTVDQAFTEFLSRLTPTQAQRDAAAKHRVSVEMSLNNALDVSLYRETGSFRHGVCPRFG